MMFLVVGKIYLLSTVCRPKMAYNGEIAALKKANANLKQENIELRRRNNLLEKQLQDSFIKNGLLI